MTTTFSDDKDTTPPAQRVTKGAAGKITNLREHILNRSDIEEETVDVPGWGCTVLVRGLTGKERAKFQKQVTANTPGAQAGGAAAINWDKFWTDLVILTVRDPQDGALLFEPTDRDQLATKAAKNLEAVAKVARRLSGLDDEALPKSEDADTDD
jgi:hypothetical protein